MTNNIFYAKITSVARICWRGSMAEQLICNQQVVGSTPITSSIYGGIPERPKGADCKSVVTDFAGPNPASPTNKTKPYGLVFFVGGGSSFGLGTRSVRWFAFPRIARESSPKANIPAKDRITSDLVFF